MWHSFAIEHHLTDQQVMLFKRFYDLLKEYNKIINLTAIDQPESIIAYHFDDSLALKNALDLSTISAIADIGTGGGFPGIPLKIAFPHLAVYLIEVTEKKIVYLNTVIKELALENIEVIPLDWRTFLRTTSLSIELFCARASLSPEELIRMFKSTSPYRESILAYWASQQFISSTTVQKYVLQEEKYTVGTRMRKLVLFQAPPGE